MTYPTKKLGEVCEFQNGLWTGKKPPFRKVAVLRNTNFKNGNGTLNFDNVAEIDVEEKQLASRLIDNCDIILERSGGGPDQPVGRVVYFEGEDNKYSFSNFTTRIRVNNKLADSRYVWRYLDFFYRTGGTEPMQKKTTGIRNLIFSEYRAIEIPLPPLPEQKKIVKKIEELFGKIDEAQKLREEAQADAVALIPAALHQIFERGKQKGWKSERLATCCDQITDGTHNAPPYALNGIPMLDTRNINNDFEIDVSTATKFITLETDQILSQRCKPKEGDILISSRGTIGKIAIVKKGQNFNIMGNIILIRPAKKLLSKYLSSFLSHVVIDINDIAQGTSQKGLYLNKMRSYEIPLPPLSEQKKIIAYLDSLSEKAKKLRELQSQTAADLKALKQSILHKAFAGGLLK